MKPIVSRFAGKKSVLEPRTIDIRREYESMDNVSEVKFPHIGRPDGGLYDESNEHDSCGLGFVADLKGRKSHTIVAQGLSILKNLYHRGATGAEENTGDGAGILLQIPDRFLREEAKKLKINLPTLGEYAAGNIFLPNNLSDREICISQLSQIAHEEGQFVLGWREITLGPEVIGPSARKAQPYFSQVFVGKGADTKVGAEFERKLYVIRKRIEHQIWASQLQEKSFFYIPSLSSMTLVYKGMLLANQLEIVFPDLNDERVESALTLVHQRFSTNTFPSWTLAQPFRFIAHNGEINTVSGNTNWMKARQALCKSEALGCDLEKLFPIVLEGNSDTASFDQVLEFLHMAGRPLPLAVLMMVPEAWSGHETMDLGRKAFYEYHSCLMEPWDGPASIAFTDGRSIGAILDRNGLRPSRYYVTTDDLVVMASEVGVLDLPPEKIKIKGRLEPGRIFLVDTELGRIIEDTELKNTYINEYPYSDWLKANKLSLKDLPSINPVASLTPTELVKKQIVFGYTEEELKLLIQPMAENGNEAIGSMGTDTALAVLSDKPRLLYDYFKQKFAQVTNPPLDGMREKLVTQVSIVIGPEGNLLETKDVNCRRLFLDSIVLNNSEFSQIREIKSHGFSSKTFDITYLSGENAIETALAKIFLEIDQAIDDGFSFIILSDRGINFEKKGIPCLLAVSSVHHHLIKNGRRSRIGLIVESGDAREVHHFATLVGYGADAVNPYIAIETITNLLNRSVIAGEDGRKNQALLIQNYIRAIDAGMTKIMSKMGISTVQSYRGAQIFEGLGLDRTLIEQYFKGTSSKISGVGLEVLAEEVELRHNRAWSQRKSGGSTLDSGGEYQWRRDGEYHLFNPETVFKLQHATQSGQYSVFKQYTAAIDDQSKSRATIRGLFKLKKTTPIPIDAVESVEEIMKRFSSGAMSYGSVSQEAHETLAIGVNRIGGRSNTGEGGEDPKRFIVEQGKDSKRSAIKQIASGRFGVTSEYLVNADDLQIKMAQGAKPGEGGQLPGYKVYPWIAKVRHSTPGVGLISPPPHHDIYSIEDLAQLIHDLKNANPQARVHVKLVAEAGVGTVAAGVAKAFSDVVLISGYDGGTGASPVTSLKHAGVPWELGLAETQQTLLSNGLRDRIVVQVDGQLKTGWDCIVAAMLGAEEFGFATAPLVVMGCIMMRVCHLNTCPVGIATQNPELRKKFNGKPEFVENFFRYIATEMREYMARLGISKVDDLIGRSDLLDTHEASNHWKAKGLDLSPILYRPEGYKGALRQIKMQDHKLEKSLDRTHIIPACAEAIASGKPVKASFSIRNVNRTVGTLLGYEITKKYGSAGLPNETIKLHFNGSAGQSFGAFLPKGISLTLEGDSNDYIGKGLSGGKIVVYPPQNRSFAAEENIIIGNVALYGATEGEAYFSGIGGERFAVRNSGAIAVVEGVGDHGCEYMTGGTVAILGATGRNFAAGMSGGTAYVFDPRDMFHSRCNKEMVFLEKLSGEDEQALERLISNHNQVTGSLLAERILSNWIESKKQFIKVMPKDYKRILDVIKTAQSKGITEEDAIMEAMSG
jgi:glutamate synthase (NADPH) large chain